MFYNSIIPFYIMPKFPNDNDYPLTLYALMNSIVNFNNDKPVRIKELSKNARSKIFEFDYPLSDKINKEDFEIMILDKFMMRRIGYDTFLPFQLALKVKLNEIMPKYNKLFDALDTWDIFKDGDLSERTLSDNKNNLSTSNVESNASTKGNSTSDRRYAQMPQNKLSDLRDGNYVSDYNYDNLNSNDSSDSNTKGNSTSTDTQNVNEIIKHSPSDKASVYKNFSSLENIYTLIFKDLDVLFYQVL